VKELLGHSSITATKRDAGAGRENKRRSAVLARNGLVTSAFSSGEEDNRVAGQWKQVIGPVAQVVEHCPFKARVPGSSPGRLTSCKQILISPGGRFGSLRRFRYGIAFRITTMNELLCKSAGGMARAILEKKISPAELIQAHLERVEAVNPRLNAIVQLPAERVIAKARAADASLARGEIKGPLHGVPVTFKDAIETAGIISTAGTLGRRTFVPQQDAVVVKSLRAADLMPFLFLADCRLRDGRAGCFVPDDFLPGRVGQIDHVPG
jgi:Amidase